MDMTREIDGFLQNKFCVSFDQKIEESGSKFRLQAQFREIRDLLRNINIGNCSPTATDKENPMRETLYSLNDVWTECQITSKTNLLARDPLRRKLSKIKEEIEKVKSSSNGGTNTQQSNDRQVSSILRWSSRSVDASMVHGFDDDVISLEKVLLKQGSEGRFKAIGITGIAGSGKTTLCQVLFNKNEVKDYFFPRIWVCMSAQPGDDPDPKIAILKRMLESLGVEEEIINNQEHNLKELLYALHLQLQGKRYLIVFDDARGGGGETDKWYRELSFSPTRDGQWDALAYGLPKECGGAVIVTSRKEEIAKKMVGSEGILHLVQPLSEPESCWLIFMKAAEQDSMKLSTSDAGIQKKEIFKRCAGHPLTAKMMGRIFKKQHPEGAAPNGSLQQLPEEGGPNESHQLLLEGAAPNGSLQQLPEEGAPNVSHQQHPEGTAPNVSHQQHPEGTAPNVSLQQHPEEGAPNGNLQQNGSLQQLPEEGAPNVSHQQHPEGTAPNVSHQQHPEGTAPNVSLQQHPEEGAPNGNLQQNGSLQQLPEEGAPNGSIQQHPEGAAPNGSLPQLPEGAASNGSGP
ncbi:probable disease resistance protein At4g19060 [Corylus avellana]|uniref:probable disease resistance protein At4g19060 n=1 Tax=Corylus avellana TaxID=13451 RepID=UPI001E1F4C3C|nr:probable disease resistance protein At4g19060 [Corylus avellana]